MEQASVGKKGSVFGSALLVGGTCIGAGMLGLPVVSAMAGFVPSVMMFFCSWLFMLITGLLVLEVTLWFPGEVNIITMAGKTIGRWGQLLGWSLFLFLFYSLMVSYAAGSGQLVVDFIDQIFGLHVPQWVGSTLCVGIFGVTVYFGAFAVDSINRLLMAGLVVTYLLLVVLGLPHIDYTLLERREWSQAFWGLPVMIISFGYHNLVPSLVTYLQRDVKRLRKAIVIGSSLPLVIYLMWQGLTLGMIPPEAFKGAIDAGSLVTHTLKQSVGSSWISDVAQYFALFAIVTSFLGVSLSFVDFLADGCKIKKDSRGKCIVCLMTFVPPLLFAIVYPNVFEMALQYAGGFGAVILFGVLPALMVWTGRDKHLANKRLVPGGRATLTAVIAFALGVFGVQLYNALYS